MPAPYEPAGAPTAEGKSEDGDMTWADYADHTRIQKKTNGDIHYIYKSRDHGVQQYSEANNCEITYYLDGRRKQVFPNGTTLEVAADKTKTQTNPDGVSITTTPNGHAIQKNPNGSSMETHPDSELLVIDFPLDRSPGDEILKWPPIKKVRRAIIAHITYLQMESTFKSILISPRLSAGLLAIASRLISTTRRPGRNGA